MHEALFLPERFKPAGIQLHFASLAVNRYLSMKPILREKSFSLYATSFSP